MKVFENPEVTDAQKALRKVRDAIDECMERIMSAAEDSHPGISTELDGLCRRELLLHGAAIKAVADA
jgi:hypothetical protein